MEECMKMKKTLLAVLTFLLVISLCACDGGGQTDASSGAASSPPQTAPPSQPSSNGEAEQEGFGEGRGDILSDEAFFTLYADLSAGSPEIQPIEKNVPLPPQEDMPSSSALLAFYLADELSEWTGLDFALNDVTFGEDSVTVDWSAESTLIAGLGEREQKEEFHFYDAIGLNWFMMDSLAQTLKNNLDVETVYYCSDGGPVTFTNPEDMAAQGLPELPADQPYEGSAFFVSRADAQG
jgi:hypothetical protein